MSLSTGMHRGGGLKNSMNYFRKEKEGPSLVLWALRVEKGGGEGIPSLLVHRWTQFVGSRSIRNFLHQLPQDTSSRQAELFCLSVLFIAAYLRPVCNNFFFGMRGINEHLNIRFDFCV